MKKILEIIFQFANLTILFEIISFFIGISSYRKIKDKPLKILTLFLVVTVCVEILGLLFTVYLKRELNVILYNNYLTLEFCFYLYLIRSFVRKKIIKMWLIIVIVIYGLLGFTNNVLLQGKSGSFSSMSYSLGCFFIISFLLYYFYELMLYPSSTTLKNQPSFWVCSGLLFFYTSTFAVFGLTNFISHLPNIVYNGISIFITITNIVLYSMFSIAFVCQTQIQKSNSLSS